MRKQIVLILVLLFASGCSTLGTPATQPTTPSTLVATSTSTPRPATTFTPTRTFTPWASIDIPTATETPGPTTPTSTWTLTPLPSATFTRILPTPSLSVICDWGGDGLVFVGNYIGMTTEFSIGSLRLCAVAPNQVGYFRLPAGPTYNWSAGVPGKGSLGKAKGTIYVGTGVNSTQIIMCINKDGLLGTGSAQCQAGAGGSTPVIVGPVPTEPPPGPTPTIPM